MRGDSRARGAAARATGGDVSRVWSASLPLTLRALVFSFVACDACIKQITGGPRLEDRGDRRVTRPSRSSGPLQFEDLSLATGAFCDGKATIRALGGDPGRAADRTANRTRRNSLSSTLITAS